MEWLNRLSKERTFNAIIGGHKIRITSDVIDDEIPLLLSKHSMKEGDNQIDLSNG